MAGSDSAPPCACGRFSIAEPENRSSGMATMLRKLLSPFSRHEEEVAAAAFGRGHPLVGALASRRARARQLVVTTAVVVFGLVTVREGHAGLGREVLGAAVVVALLLALGLWFARGRAREQARDLIADGRSEPFVRVVADERRRLASRRERERLARTLEGYIHDASRATRIDPRARPPLGVRCLLLASREALEVTRLVRSDASSPRGVAALWRFLTDGQRSSLFGCDSVKLRWELLRIAALLEPDDSRGARRAA